MKIGLRYKFIGIVLLAALPFLFYAVYHYITTLNENKNLAISKNVAVAEDTAERVEAFINSSQNVLYSLALHPAVINLDSSKCDEIFSQLLPLYPANEIILAADMNGRNYGSALEPETAHKFNYSDREWFIRASKGVSYVSDLYISKLFNNPVFMIAVPVFDSSGEQTSVLGFPVNLFKLKEYLNEIEKINYNSIFCLIDSKGTILIDSHRKEATGTQFMPRPLLQKITKERKGSLIDFDQNGTEYFFSFATVESTGWKVLVGIPSSTVSSEAASEALRHLIFFILICLTGGLSSLWYCRKLGTKIANIIRGLNEVAAGNFAIRLISRGNDEIAQASDAFNRMTSERSKAEEEIKNFTATLEKKVELRTIELTRAKNELEAFSYAISHDLQAPVRHILSFSQILLDEQSSELSDNARDCLQRIRKSGRHMRDLITHLLELSRLNRQELSRVETDIGSVSRIKCDEFAADDPSRFVEVVIADGLIASCDPNLIAIVMENLLGNAWKYTRKITNPRIEVGETVFAGVHCFFVKDNGSGFDMAYAHRLFTPFQRLHAADEFEGTGVGLATVMRVIQRHEGSIWADSSPGNGAAFYFTLNHECDKKRLTNHENS